MIPKEVAGERERERESGVSRPRATGKSSAGDAMRTGPLRSSWAVRKRGRAITSYPKKNLKIFFP